MARPKKDYDLIPYALYLHPVIDRDLIEKLEPYRQTSRTGSVIRDALRAFFGFNGSPRAMPVINEARLQEPPIQSISSVSTSEAKQRVKNAFM